jgi:DNA repair protein RecN (Recombination protein N)
MANRKELAGMNMDASERAKRVDFLRFEEEEIEAAKLISGEDTELEALYTKMNNAKEICEITESVYSSTGYDSSNSAGNQISRSLQKLKSIERYDKDAEPLITTLTDIEAILNEFNQSLSEYIEGSTFEEKTYVETEQRLNLINTLKSKYGRSIEDIQNSLEAIKTELDSLSDYEARLEELTVKEKELQKALEEMCAVLSEARKVKAAELSAKITEALKSLNFSDVQFYMDMKRLPECTAEGFDSITFMISTNVGEEPKPLHMVASGGELSRIMLATKSVLADVWDTPTLIFDEVDTGISGITAQKVAEMMKELSRTHQIISITHLPQIASKADNSFLIEKTVTDGRTFTGIRAIEGKDKVMELARLLGGDSITESVITAAREMLA